MIKEHEYWKRKFSLARVVPGTGMGGADVSAVVVVVPPPLGVGIGASWVQPERPSRKVANRTANLGERARLRTAAFFGLTRVRSFGIGILAS